MERRPETEGGMVCRTTTVVTGCAQPSWKQLAQKRPACRDIHHVDSCADLAYIPDEVLHRIWVGKVIVAIENGCEYLKSVRLVATSLATESGLLTLKTPRPRMQLIKILRLSDICVFGMMRNGIMSRAMSAEMFQAVANVRWW